jgi:soluble lytic murein transglycosylase-like protein
MILRKMHWKGLPAWAKEFDFLEIIEKQSTLHGVDPYQILALVQTESRGIHTSVRYEKSFRWIKQDEVVAFSKILGSTQNTTRNLLKNSFGLCQIMGQVFAEHGGMENSHPAHRWPTSMLDKRIGIYYGCKVWRWHFDRHGPMVDEVYASFNGGSPRRVPDGSFENQDQVDNYIMNYSEIMKGVRY